MQHVSEAVGRLLFRGVVSEFLHGAFNPFEHVGLDALVEKSRDEAFNLGMVSTLLKFNSIILRF